MNRSVIAALASGALFGVGLAISRMTDRLVVLVLKEIDRGTQLSPERGEQRLHHGLNLLGHTDFDPFRLRVADRH